MAQQHINLGTPPGGADGDTIRSAMLKAESNFNELYTGALAVSTFKNKLINGNFDFWQRGTSFNTVAYTSDRWQQAPVGSTATTSRQAFASGQTAVPGNPTYYSRTVVASVAGAGNFATLVQKIESIKSISGKTVTVSFWAKADANRNIGIGIRQDFGQGGAPSAQSNIAGQLVALTTAWQKFSVTFAVPAIGASSIGTTTDGWVGLVFYFDAGANSAVMSGGVGQQSGTFDLAQIQLEVGATATSFEERPLAMELMLCQRYMRFVQGGGLIGFAASANTVIFTASWPTMRTSPAVTLLKTSYTTAAFEMNVGGTWVAGSGCALVGPSINTQGMTSQMNGFTGMTSGAVATFNCPPANVLLLDAEL